MAKRCEVPVGDRRDVVLNLLRREEPAMLPNFWKFLTRLCLSLILSFAAVSVWAQSPVITYLVSSENKVNGSTELVRLVDGQIASRLSLGHSVVYGYSDSHVAVMGYLKTGYVLRTWSLATGQEQTHCVLNNLPATPFTYRIGVSSALLLDPSGSHVLYMGFKKEKRERELSSGRKVPYDVMVSSPVAVDIRTGESFELATPFELPLHAVWKFVDGQYGLRSKDGLFAIYDPKNKSFGKQIDLSGQARDWLFHIPGLGFAKTDKQRRTILVANMDSVPLEPPRIVSGYTDYHSQRFRLDNDGRSLLFVAKRPKESSTTIMIRDLGDEKTLFEREFPIKVYHIQVANDCHAWLLRAKKSKRALYFDKDTERTTEIVFSWASLPRIIPYFGNE